MKATKPLHSAKLIPPARAKGLVDRTALAARLLAAAQSAQVTLLSAPAGAGKTSAVLALTEHLAGVPIAWLSLDSGDQELGVFVPLLVDALRQHYPAFGSHALAQLQTSADPSALHIAGALNNELLASVQGPLFIVLDDLHRIETGPVYELLDHLLERLPKPVHLIITTRHDPPLRLAQLRLRGLLAEFRQEQLQMSSEETAQVVQAVSGYQLAPDELALVNERTQGWAAGVKLVALWLGQLDGGQRAGRVKQLAATQRLLFDYLVQEVLQQAAPATRDFLLQTSLLDPLTPPACDAVTGRNDSAAMLQQLYQQNYFLTLMEGASETYHYHPLFVQFLQKELPRQGWDIAQLHRRAASVSASPEQRIEHWLAAAAWDDAIPEIIRLGQAQCERHYVTAQIMDWLGRLPSTARTHYWLDLIEANHARQKGNDEKCTALTLKALPEAEANNDTLGILEGVWNLYFFNKEELWHVGVEEAMAGHANISLARRAHYLIGKTWGHLNLYQWPETEQYFERYLTLIQKADNADLYYAAAQHIGPQMFFVRGGMAKLHQMDMQALRFADEGDVLQAGTFMRMGWFALLQGNLQAVTQYKQQARGIIESIGHFAYMDLMVDYLRYYLLLAHGQYAELLGWLQREEAQQHAYETRRVNLPGHIFSIWRAQWAMGDIQGQRITVERSLGELGRLPEWSLSPCKSLMLGWQAFNEGDLIGAEQYLADAGQHQRQVRWVGTWGNAELDLPLFYVRSGQADKALAAWSQAAQRMIGGHMPGLALLCGPVLLPLLQLARQQGAYAELAEASMRQLGAMLEPAPIFVQTTRQTLTRREVEALQLLVQGASNQEIADKLVITLRTAKAHVSSILAKLGVATRAEAIAFCRETALLS